MMRSVFLVMTVAAAEPGYVDPAICARCHPGIAASFAKTGMGRSIQPARLTGSTYYHRISNRHYRVSEREGAWYVRRHQMDAMGNETNVVEARVDLVIGSGNHARTPVSLASSDRLLQLPVSWYAENGGFWAMSPGYDKPDHLGFRREISDECLFCHAAYPAAWNQGRPAPIDCQRCHGPGEAHLRKPRQGTIFNPARAPAHRKSEVCLQCHLETASQGIPNAIRRAGRAVYSYRPGEPLTDYVLHFDHADGHEEKFEINHAAYRMRQSRCAPLACTTCHDPHTAGPRTTWRAACQGCHSSSHAARDADCVNCHMPKRRTGDAVHVVMTDHRIGRRPPPGDLLAQKRESHAPYKGPVAAYYPPTAEPLYLAMAQVREFNHLTDGIAALKAAIARYKPKAYEFYFQLGEAQRAAGDLRAAESAYREALRRDRANTRVKAALGDALLRQGRIQEAIPILESANHRMALAVAYGQTGRLSDSLRLLKELVAAEPESALAWLNLGVTLEQSGDTAGAAAAYREAIRHQPDSAQARQHLNSLRSR
ncbi:MAG: tetratricopeptide repeat protein [Bryobacteraceae bacterium]|nr:tetratricopeptide repeat protein [Bryobacteraceae bacterium]